MQRLLESIVGLFCQGILNSKFAVTRMLNFLSRTMSGPTSGYFILRNLCSSDREEARPSLGGTERLYFVNHFHARLRQLCDIKLTRILLLLCLRDVPFVVHANVGVSGLPTLYGVLRRGVHQDCSL